MNQHSTSDVSEQVHKFVPKETLRQAAGPADDAGRAVLAKLQQAAKLSNDNFDRAMALAHKLSLQLRAAEDRMNQLQAEVELYKDRALRAEAWLQQIEKQIEEKFLAPMAASPAEQTSRILNDRSSSPESASVPARR